MDDVHYYYGKIPIPNYYFNFTKTFGDKMICDCCYSELSEEIYELNGDEVLIKRICPNCEIELIVEVCNINEGDNK